MTYSQIQKQDLNECVSMALSLWPHAQAQKLMHDFKSSIRSLRQVTYVCKNEKKVPIAFLSLTIRRDYVEGSKSSPVGYIEGIYIKSSYRNQGVAKRLVKFAEAWSRAHKCKELGSDTEMSNLSSQKFHKKVGFKEAGKIIHFIKKI